MNILFLNNAEISPISNGIQRVTHVLSQGFIAHQNARCFSAYFEKNSISPKTEFHGKQLLTRGHELEQLSEFIAKNDISMVICQQLIINREKFSWVQQAIAQNPGCKSFFCLHACPSYVFVRPNIRADFFRLIHRKQVIKSLKKILVGVLPEQIYTNLVKKETKQKYTLIRTYFDQTILLSESYIPSFLELCGDKNQTSRNVKFISNPLSFESNISEQEILDKQEEVIIVSRLSDRQKRVSDALYIWQKINRNPISENWKLTIVGAGEDEPYYKHLARKLSLRNVFFEGRQDPVEYYKRASICLLTSAYEGWPMNIIEAQQTGVVPIVFDSYSALHDVVENNVNGLIIPYRDTKKYSEKLLWLMSHKNERQEMAVNGLKNCERFSIENTTKQWIKLFGDSK